MDKNYYSLLTISMELNNRELFKISNHILNDKLIVKYKYIPKSLNNIPCQLHYSKNFNWNIDLQETTNMAMLHLHSLDPIKYLLLSYNKSKNSNLLKKSIDLLFSWNRHANKNPNFYTWYTHCVADRAIIIGILLSEMKDSSCKKEIILELQSILRQHQEFLLNKDNYKELNHGTMIDRSLLFSSLILKDKKSIDFSINRLRKNFQITFTEDMVCVENSVTYSIFNIELFVSIEKVILNKIGNSLHEDFDLLINKSLDFIDSIKMPNDTFPHYGDGEKVNLSSLKNSIIHNYYDRHKLFENYNASNKMEVYFYQKEGFIVFKNKNQYLLCNCGSLRINHKHADDGSIIYYNNEEVFVDSGIYSYDKNDLRTYFKSNIAHNSLVLNNEFYDYAKSPLNNGYISNFIEKEEYYYFQLVNNHYKYAQIIRHVFIIKNSFKIIIHDQIISPIYNLNTQIFNLSPSIKHVKNVSGFQNTISLNNNVLITFDSNTSFNSKKISIGKYADKFHSLKDIYRLELIKNGKNQAITTLIQHHKQSALEIDTKLLEFNKIILSNNKKQYILDLQPVNENLLIDQYLYVKNLNNKYYWKVYSNYYSEEEYAFYIYKDGVRFDTLWYSESNTIEYDFYEPGIYSIRCFIRNKNNHDEKTAFRGEQEIQISDF